MDEFIYSVENSSRTVALHSSKVGMGPVSWISKLLKGYSSAAIFKTAQIIVHFMNLRKVSNGFDSTSKKNYLKRNLVRLQFIIYDIAVGLVYNERKGDNVTVSM